MDNRDEIIKELENVINIVREHGAQRLITVVKIDDNKTVAGWIAVDVYNFGGMMMQAAQMLSNQIGQENPE